jgi:hypothetical protein
MCTFSRCEMLGLERVFFFYVMLNVKMVNEMVSMEKTIYF